MRLRRYDCEFPSGLHNSDFAALGLGRVIVSRRARFTMGGDFLSLFDGIVSRGDWESRAPPFLFVSLLISIIIAVHFVPFPFCVLYPFLSENSSLRLHFALIFNSVSGFRGIHAWNLRMRRRKCRTNTLTFGGTSARTQISPHTLKPCVRRTPNLCNLCPSSLLALLSMTYEHTYELAQKSDSGASL